MTTAQLNIFVSLSALEPLPDGEERSRVPYKWSINGFGLNLASYEPMLEASSLKMGCNAPLAPCRSAIERRSRPTGRTRRGKQVYRGQ